MSGGTTRVQHFMIAAIWLKESFPLFTLGGPLVAPPRSRSHCCAATEEDGQSRQQVKPQAVPLRYQPGSEVARPISFYPLKKAWKMGGRM